MPQISDQPEMQFTVVCLRCDRPMLARYAWAGREIQCPHCASYMRVPEPTGVGRPVRAEAPDLNAKRVFNFPCPRCRCLLEGHTGMIGQPGTCPTCAGRFIVPAIRGRRGIPETATLVDSPGDQPTPVHAYAASGHQAPILIRRADDSVVIECPRCHAYNPVEADVCDACATPFTIDAAPTLEGIRSDQWSTAALTLGFLSLLLFILLVPGLLAILFGLGAMLSPRQGGFPVRAAAGAIMGALSLAGGLAYWWFF